MTTGIRSLFAYAKMDTIKILRIVSANNAIKDVSYVIKKSASNVLIQLKIHKSFVDVILDTIGNNLKGLVNNVIKPV